MLTENRIFELPLRRAANSLDAILTSQFDVVVQQLRCNRARVSRSPEMPAVNCKISEGRAFIRAEPLFPPFGKHLELSHLIPQLSFTNIYVLIVFANLDFAAEGRRSLLGAAEGRDYI